jgi:hypothetical protein
MNHCLHDGAKYVEWKLQKLHFSRQEPPSVPDCFGNGFSVNMQSLKKIKFLLKVILKQCCVEILKAGFPD